MAHEDEAVIGTVPKSTGKRDMRAELEAWRQLKAERASKQKAESPAIRSRIGRPLVARRSPCTYGQGTKSLKEVTAFCAQGSQCQPSSGSSEGCPSENHNANNQTIHPGTQCGLPGQINPVSGTEGNTGDISALGMSLLFYEERIAPPAAPPSSPAKPRCHELCGINEKVWIHALEVAVCNIELAVPQLPQCLPHGSSQVELPASAISPGLDLDAEIERLPGTQHELVIDKIVDGLEASGLLNDESGSLSPLSLGSPVAQINSLGLI